MRAALLSVAVGGMALTLTGHSSNAQVAVPPNFVVIVTDDQAIGSLGGMPNVRALAASGTTFTSAIISNPLCCPARAAILTGEYSHTNGVYTNALDGYGGYPAFIDHHDEEHTFALALHDAGYSTGLFGKYLNHYDGTAQLGWDAFHSFVGPNGAYYDYAWAIDGAAPIMHGSLPTDYSTAVAGSEADAWLRSLDRATPFLLYFAPYAPHAPATAAPGDVGKVTSSAFDTPAYNETDVSDKPAYIQTLSPYGGDAYAGFTSRWDMQYATLLSVDRWIGTLRATLSEAGALDNTYFIFLSDNGFTWGDHRWNYKLVPYERSIHVPFVVAGPGVVWGKVHRVVSNIDIASTILGLAGVPPITSDGLSLTPLLTRTGGIRRAGVLLEHKEYLGKRPVPSYCGFRTTRWMFARYATGEEELYDLRHDPYELQNIAARKPDKTSALRAKTYAAGCDPVFVTPPA